jgi:hypothetical protein
MRDLLNQLFDGIAKKSFREKYIALPEKSVRITTNATFSNRWTNDLQKLLPQGGSRFGRALRPISMPRLWR